MTDAQGRQQLSFKVGEKAKKNHGIFEELLKERFKSLMYAIVIKFLYKLILTALLFVS